MNSRDHRSLARGESWEDFSFERSSIDAATRATDGDGIGADDSRRVGKPSSTYGGRRGYSVPPIKKDAPQTYGTLNGRWRMFNSGKHSDGPAHVTAAVGAATSGGMLLPELVLIESAASSRSVTACG